jgi:superfamily II DNA helicase RecQ
VCSKRKKIVSGTWQIVLISPELLLSRRFIKEVIISHWGSGFRKKYGELGILRSFLLNTTPIVAVSATLPPRVRRDVLRVLRFDMKNFVDINIGNDRPNVSLVIRGIQHPLNTYIDLDFIIPSAVQDAAGINKTFIYCDNIAMGTEIIDHLTGLLPIHLRGAGLIRPFNACFSKEYRKAAMVEFKSGNIQVLVVIIQGCNIPDVDFVVQWKLPKSISAFVQRAGRSARVSGRVGLAVMLVEQSIYATLLDTAGRRHRTPEIKRPTVFYKAQSVVQREESMMLYWPMTARQLMRRQLMKVSLVLCRQEPASAKS